MSFLATECADDSALCELLEIVDTWTPGASAAGGQRLAEDAPSSVSSGSDDGHSEGTKNRRRVRNPEVDVRRRLKKKQERERLFALVHELQGRRDQLRRRGRCRCSSPTMVADSGVCRCCVTIDEQLAAALEANRQLKSEASKNEILLQLLHDAVSVSKVEMELTPHIVASAMAAHRSALQDMHTELGSVFQAFPRLSTNEPFFYRSDIKFDAAGSPRTEISTALYLPCDFHHASSTIAEGIAQLAPFGNAVSHCLETQADSAEQPYSLCGRNRNTNTSSLQSVGLVQKHQDDDSMVLMWSSQIFHPTAGIAFIGRARIRITGLTSERTLVEAFTDVSAQEVAGISPAPSIDPEVAKSVRSALIGAFGSRVGYKHKIFLKLMLVSSGRSHIAAALVL